MLQKRVAEATEALDQLKIRTAFQVSFYGIWNDLRWYLKRVKAPRTAAVTEVLGSWVRLLAPFAPFLAEELHSVLGYEGFVSVVLWPAVRRDLMDADAELAEEMVSRLIEDVKKVIKLIPQANRLHVYCSPLWKMQLMSEMISSKAKGRQYGEGLKAFSASYPEFSGQAGSLLSKLVKLIHDLGEPFIASVVKTQRIDEYQTFSSSSSFLSQELGVEVMVHNEDEDRLYDPKKRASNSLPFRPALYIE